ncbi:hypothetical protein M153_37540001351 [Pseudoloma neurophilia]|uniref:Uncharacterized protein n=1 Tax=Pseudoloma neurophilia TaxID=146866 RepID=A0A0R0LT65_9MICR|nr:hypothetical protein M153_37540001351 [Pseudoloma neurophilia]
MVYSKEEVEKLLSPKLKIKELRYEKFFDDNDHVNLNILIKSKNFNGMPILDRQRTVNELLAIDFEKIHSVTIDCDSDH